ncbi:MAG: AAA family ATPase [Dehalococcoidia bacterium]
MSSTIPRELRRLNQWVVYRVEQRNGKATKVPYQTTGVTKASSTNPSTWATRREARVAAERFDGTGFVFSKDDPFCGIDLDHCRNAGSGEIAPWAWDIIKDLASYTEISPSGTGVHVIVRAALPTKRRKKGDIEMYDAERFFCMTGHHLRGTPKTIKKRQKRIRALHRRVFGKADAIDATPAGGYADAERFSDKALIAKAKIGKHGEAFRQLWEGSAAYPSESEGDLALCNRLAYWTNNDADRVDRLFRQSRLYRSKWDEKRGDETYGELTIRKALDGAFSRNGQGADFIIEADSKLYEVNGAEVASRDSQSDLPSLPVFGHNHVVIQGWSHLLGSAPKTGKTETVTAWCQSWRSLGLRVLFFTEEPESVWSARFAQHGGDWSHVQLVFAIGATTDEMLERIGQGDESVVVIDTVRTLIGVEDESDNAAIGRALTPFIAASRSANKTLLLLHHLRKSGGDHGAAISGGHAFVGIVDVVLELHRLDNPQARTRRSITGLARVVEVPEIAFDRRDDGSFRVIGIGGITELDFDRVKDRVFEVLPTKQRRSTTTEMREALSEPRPSRTQVTEALHALRAEGRAGRHPKHDRKGGTYTWWKQGTHRAS